MKKYICEFVGTFVLVLIGCGVAVVTNADIVATSLAFGLVIVAMAYSIGNVSGCHINPAVSLSMLITKKMSTKDFIWYVVSQVLGAIVGAFVLGFLLDDFASLGTNGFGEEHLALTALVAFIVEVILTFIFILVILCVTSKKENKNISGLVIGLTLVLVHLIGIKFTGTSVNPARSFGPALLTMEDHLFNSTANFGASLALKQVWVFILAPLVGSLFASLFYKGVLAEK